MHIQTNNSVTRNVPLRQSKSASNSRKSGKSEKLRPTQIMLEGIISRCKEKGLMAPRDLKKVEKLQSDQQKLKEAVNVYKDMQKTNSAAEEGVTISTIISERRVAREDNIHNFFDKEVIDRFKADNIKLTQYLRHMGKKKRIWKPRKFIISRKAQIAESFDQLLH